MPEYVVNLKWDDKTDVWIATSDDIPGIALESGSLDALIARVRVAAPELLELNGAPREQMYLYYKSERHDLVGVHG